MSVSGCKWAICLVNLVSVVMAVDSQQSQALPGMRAQAEERMQVAQARIDALDKLSNSATHADASRERLRLHKEELHTDLKSRIRCAGSVCTLMDSTSAAAPSHIELSTSAEAEPENPKNAHEPIAMETVSEQEAAISVEEVATSEGQAAAAEENAEESAPVEEAVQEGAVEKPEAQVAMEAVSEDATRALEDEAMSADEKAEKDEEEETEEEAMEAGAATIEEPEPEQLPADHNKLDYVIGAATLLMIAGLLFIMTRYFKSSEKVESDAVEDVEEGPTKKGNTEVSKRAASRRGPPPSRPPRISRPTPAP